MKTKPIPAIVMLTGGFVACVLGILNHMETTAFMKMLLLVLFIFYILGGIIKIVLDKGFPEPVEKNEKEETVEKSDAEKENIEAESDEE